MSLTNIKSKIQSERGFTIVELLIVVVVIAILAAITIVSYNGITRSANDSAAKQQASTVAKKIESYQASKGSYPANFSQLNDSAEAFNLTSGVLTTGSPTLLFQINGLSDTNGKTTVVVRKCAASGATQAAITAPTGIEIRVYDYVNAAGQTTNGVIQAVLGTNTGTIGNTAATSTCPATQG